MRGRRALLICAALALWAGCGGGDDGGDGGRGERPAAEAPRAPGPSCITASNKPGRREAEARDIYLDLREKALRVEPGDIGLRPSAELPRVYGVMMETGYPEGCATLFALADGTASLYLSPGGGFIGGGERPQIAEASRAFVKAAEAQLDAVPASRRERLPPNGWVVLRVLTYDGARAIEAREDDLGYDRHELSPLFHAGHEVIARIRRVDEAKQP